MPEPALYVIIAVSFWYYPGNLDRIDVVRFNIDGCFIRSTGRDCRLHGRRYADLKF